MASKLRTNFTIFRLGCKRQLVNKPENFKLDNALPCDTMILGQQLLFDDYFHLGVHPYFNLS
jgi:hypothetical protein